MTERRSSEMFKAIVPLIIALLFLAACDVVVVPMELPPEDKAVVFESRTTETKTEPDGKVKEITTTDISAGYRLENKSPYYRRGNVPKRGNSVLMCTTKTHAYARYKGVRMSGSRCFYDKVNNGRPVKPMYDACIWASTPPGATWSNYYVTPGRCRYYY